MVVAVREVLGVSFGSGLCWWLWLDTEAVEGGLVAGGCR